MYRKLTHDIEVTVAPRFLPEHSSEEKRRYVWSYTVSIVNRGSVAVRLRTRHWIITNQDGAVEEVRGAGVVGEQPLIAPGATYTYTSGCPLTTPSGIMVGSYGMEGPDGTGFEVAIPAFSLDLPDARPTVN